MLSWGGGKPPPQNHPSTKQQISTGKPIPAGCYTIAAFDYFSPILYCRTSAKMQPWPTPFRVWRHLWLAGVTKHNIGPVIN